MRTVRFAGCCKEPLYKKQAQVREPWTRALVGKARKPLLQGFISLSRTRAVLIGTPGSDCVNSRGTKKSSPIWFLLELQSERLVGDPESLSACMKANTFTTPQTHIHLGPHTLLLNVTVIHVQFPEVIVCDRRNTLLLLARWQARKNTVTADEVNVSRDYIWYS